MRKKMHAACIACAVFAVFVSCGGPGFQGEAVLTKELVANFVRNNNYAGLFKNLQMPGKVGWLEIDQLASPADALKKIGGTRMPKNVRSVFDLHSFDSEKGHVQFAVMHYGIVALEIESVLDEIKNSGEVRDDVKQKCDNQMSAYMQSIFAVIHPDDIKIIREYQPKLRDIFNTNE